MRWGGNRFKKVCQGFGLLFRIDEETTSWIAGMTRFAATSMAFSMMSVCVSFNTFPLFEAHPPVLVMWEQA
jgi:hypothetical protein